MFTDLRAACLVTTAPSQTESKQPPVCVRPLAVWPLSVKQGPTRWASRSLTLLRFLTAQLDRRASVLRFTGIRCLCGVSPERPKNISHAPIRHVFQAWSHTGEKSTPPLPSLHCSVSKDQPVTGRHRLQTSRCQDSFDKSVVEGVFWNVLSISMAQADTSSRPHIHNPNVSLTETAIFKVAGHLHWCHVHLLFILCVKTALWQDQMDTPALKTCKVEEDLRPWPG